MRIQPTILALASTASCSLLPRNPPTNSTTTPSVVAAQYDGTCFYPVPDATFNLNSYLGTWYQVAGTPFGPTAGARCVTANYSLNVRPLFFPLYQNLSPPPPLSRKVGIPMYTCTYVLVLSMRLTLRHT